MNIERESGEKSAGFLSTIYEPTLVALDQAGVKVCLMRDDPELLDSVLELDLLICPDSLETTLNTLVVNEWVLLDTGTFIPLKRALLRWHNGMLLKIDLHLALIDGSLIYMDAEWMLDSATKTPNGYWLPSSEAWYLHVILHSILGKPKLHEKYHARMQALEISGIDMVAIHQQTEEYGLNSYLEFVWSDPTGVLCNQETVLDVRQELKKTLISSGHSNRARTLLYKVWWYVGHSLGCRRGFVVAVIGPDGAGKTTFLTEMKRVLKRLEISRRTVYMGPWEYPILPTSRWIRTLGASPKDKITNTDRSVPIMKRCFKITKGLCKRYMYYGNVMLEMWARYFLKIWPQLRKRRIVIADRYTYDLEVGYYNLPVKNSNIIRRTIANLVPKPAYTILLENNAEVIWNRKKEYPKEVIDQSLAMYKEIAKRRGCHVIRTDKPVDEIVEAFLEQNWVEMTELRKDGGHGKNIGWYEF